MSQLISLEHASFNVMNEVVNNFRPQVLDISIDKKYSFASILFKFDYLVENAFIKDFEESTSIQGVVIHTRSNGTHRYTLLGLDSFIADSLEQLIQKMDDYHQFNTFKKNKDLNHDKAA